MGLGERDVEPGAWSGAEPDGEVVVDVVVETGAAGGVDAGVGAEAKA